MEKLLHGGAVASYGPAFPTSGIAFDGTLFYKNDGADAGLYIYSHNQNPAALAQGQILSWSPIATTDLFVSKSGDTMTGKLTIKGTNTSAAYGLSEGVLNLVNTANTVGARSGAIQWSYANSTGIAAQLDILNGTSGTANMSFGLFSTGSVKEVMQLTPNGLITGTGKPYWNEDNDGIGTNLDAGKFAGQLPAYYQNASNINAGTLNVARLPFTPVQQGGGTGQGTNKVYIGYAASGGTLNLQVDSTNFVNVWPISITGNAATASTANTAGSATTAGYATNASFLHFDGGTATGKISLSKTIGSGSPTYIMGISTIAGGTGTSAAAFYNATNLTVGKATSADKLTTARTINGTPFDGTAPITIIDTTRVAKGGDTMTGNLTISSGTASTNWANGALVVGGGVGISGHMFVAGNMTTESQTITRSDERVKTKIEPIEDALNKVDRVRGTTYDRTDVNTPRQAGLIAQDFIGVLDEVIITDEETGLLGVNYNGVIALLVEAVKELRTEVKQLQAEVQELKSR